MNNWMQQQYPYVKNWGIYACPDDTRPFSENATSESSCLSCGPFGGPISGLNVIPGTGPGTGKPSKFFKNSYGMNEYIGDPFNPGAGRMHSLPTMSYPANTILFADSVFMTFSDWGCSAGAKTQQDLIYNNSNLTRIMFANAGTWGASGNFDQWKGNIRHSGNAGSNIAFADGHAKYKNAKSFFLDKCPQDADYATTLPHPSDPVFSSQQSPK